MTHWGMLMKGACLYQGVTALLASSSDCPILALMYLFSIQPSLGPETQASHWCLNACSGTWGQSRDDREKEVLGAYLPAPSRRHGCRLTHPVTIITTLFWSLIPWDLLLHRANLSCLRVREEPCHSGLSHSTSLNPAYIFLRSLLINFS